MSERTIPIAVLDHVCSLLCGRDEAGSAFCDIESDDLAMSIKSDCYPRKGLSDRYIEAIQEHIHTCKRISDVYFYCRTCGEGPHSHPEDKEYLLILEEFRSKQWSIAERLEKEIDLLHRLIDTDLMADVYNLLQSSRLDDHQLVSFIDAARNARGDFSEFRRIKKRAEKRFKEISQASERLGWLIQDLQNLGVCLPPELQLRRKEHKFYPIIGRSDAETHLREKRFLETFSLKQQPGAQTTDMKQALFDLAELAGSCPVDLGSPEIKAAICTRQNSEKTAYLRSFGTLLEQSGIELTPVIMRAMACTANVIFDDPDASISEDNVRKALNRLNAKQNAEN